MGRSGSYWDGYDKARRAEIEELRARAGGHSYGGYGAPLGDGSKDEMNRAHAALYREQARKLRGSSDLFDRNFETQARAEGMRFGDKIAEYANREKERLAEDALSGAGRELAAFAQQRRNSSEMMNRAITGSLLAVAKAMRDGTIDGKTAAEWLKQRDMPVWSVAWNDGTDPAMAELPRGLAVTFLGKGGGAGETRALVGEDLDAAIRAFSPSYGDRALGTRKDTREEARLEETTRHNLAGEGIARGRADETTRHNLAGEGIARGRADETTRHNLAGEALRQSTQEETARHHQAGEALRQGKQEEDARRNKENEKLQWEELYRRIAKDNKPGGRNAGTLKAAEFKALEEAFDNDLDELRTTISALKKKRDRWFSTLTAEEAEKLARAEEAEARMMNEAAELKRRYAAFIGGKMGVTLPSSSAASSGEEKEAPAQSEGGEPAVQKAERQTPSPAQPAAEKGDAESPIVMRAPDDGGVRLVAVGSVTCLLGEVWVRDDGQKYKCVGIRGDGSPVYEDVANDTELTPEGDYELDAVFYNGKVYELGKEYLLPKKRGGKAWAECYKFRRDGGGNYQPCVRASKRQEAK